MKQTLDFCITCLVSFIIIVICAFAWGTFWMWAASGADFGVFLALFGVASIPAAMVFATLLHLSE
jgi:hypothetical protein